MTHLVTAARAYYKHLNTEAVEQLQEAIIVKMVTAIRSDMPRIGGKKLYHLLKEPMQAHGIDIGRDKLFETLGTYNLLVRRRKRNQELPEGVSTEIRAKKKPRKPKPGITIFSVNPSPELEKQRQPNPGLSLTSVNFFQDETPTASQFAPLEPSLASPARAVAPFASPLAAIVSLLASPACPITSSARPIALPAGLPAPSASLLASSAGLLCLFFRSARA